MTTRIVHNCETNEITEVEIPQEELEAMAQADADLEEQKASSLAARQAILDKLGITADEARLLLS